MNEILKDDVWIKKISISFANNKHFTKSFVNGINVIWSKKNSVGKTLILKSMLFVLGENKNIFLNEGKNIKSISVELSINGFSREYTRLINDKIVNHYEWLNNKTAFRFESGFASRPQISKFMRFLYFGQQKKIDAQSGIKTFHVTTRNDFSRFYSGFDISKYISLESEVKKYKKEAYKKMKLKKIDDILKEGVYDKLDIDKIINQSDRKIKDLKQELNLNIKDYKDIISQKNTIQELSKIYELKKEYFSKMIKKINGYEVNAWEIIKDNHDLQFSTPISKIFEMENKLSELKLKIKFLKSEIKKLEDDLYIEINQDTKQNIAITYFKEILVSTDPNYIDKNGKIKELDKKIKQIKQEGNVVVSKKIEELLILRRSYHLDLSGSDSGAVQELENIINSIDYQKTYNVPILIDGFAEALTSDNFDKIIKFIDEKSYGQIFIAQYDTEEKKVPERWNKIILDKSIEK